VLQCISTRPSLAPLRVELLCPGRSTEKVQNRAGAKQLLLNVLQNVAAGFDSVGAGESCGSERPGGYLLQILSWVDTRRLACVWTGVQVPMHCLACIKYHIAQSKVHLAPTCPSTLFPTVCLRCHPCGAICAQALVLYVWFNPIHRFRTRRIPGRLQPPFPHSFLTTSLQQHKGLVLTTSCSWDPI
jgi:hypothetical protein